MPNKDKFKTLDFEKISLSNESIKLPLTILGLMKSEKKDPPKLSFSSFYRTELYYTIAFYKPISKIFSHEHE